MCDTCNGAKLVRQVHIRFAIPCFPIITYINDILHKADVNPLPIEFEYSAHGMLGLCLGAGRSLGQGLCQEQNFCICSM